MKQRLVATMPLISLFMLLVSGFVFDNWKLGFSFLFLVPLSWILLSDHLGKRIHQSMPLITVILFLWLAFGFDLAHPGWVVFFLIPLSDMIYEGKIDARKVVSVSITFIYIIIGIIYPRAFFPDSLRLLGDSFWHPGWLIFLLIPIINNLFFPNKTNIIFMNKTEWKDKIKHYIND
ncbi:MAG: hypothetical protein UMR38_02965 [Candidatus Izemoplasma sp.]|nr:hypothetical protein [Candidatus Izemoplasma sp.]